MPDYRSNADKRKAVVAKFQALIKEFGSLDQIPKWEWSDRKIAEHCGVSNRMVSDIHAELTGAPARWSVKKSAKQEELQRARKERDRYKAQLEAAIEKNRQLELEVGRLRAESALLRSPQISEEWRIELAGEKIRIISPKNERVRLTVRSFPGWIWESGDYGRNLKGWYLPLGVAEQALEALKDFSFEVDPAIIPAAQRWKAEAYQIKLQGNELLLLYPHEDKRRVEPLVNKVEPNPRWENGLGKNPEGWYVPLDKAEQLLEALKGLDFVVDPAIAKAIANWKAEQQQQAEEAAQTTINLVASAQLDAPLPNGWTLFKHQKEGAQWLLAHRSDALYRGGILADHMGLGKTGTALIAAKAMKAVFGCHVFVICPASLQENWVREAGRVGVQIEVFSWVKVPKPLDTAKFVAIADEAHYAQSLSSQRTKKLFALADSPNCLATWLLTGTPIKNGRPINLFPLLMACGHPLAENRREYELYFCAAGYREVGRDKVIWDVSGAAHLDELSRKTEDVILRRTKKECLDLPPKIRQLRPVELSKQAQAVYDETFETLRKKYLERIKKKQISSGGEALVMLGQLRQAASIAKVESAIELAMQVLEQGDQVVLFTEFVESARQLHEALGGELLTGETDTDQRQAIVDRFQAGECKVFVGTIKAGGLGLTLTAATTVFLCDRPWTPGEAEQAEDRCYRIGQQQTVTAVWLQLGDIDKAIDSLLESKQGHIELVLKGKQKTLSGLTKPAELALELLQVMFGGKREILTKPEESDRPRSRS